MIRLPARLRFTGGAALTLHPRVPSFGNGTLAAGGSFTLGLANLMLRNWCGLVPPRPARIRSPRSAPYAEASPLFPIPCPLEILMKHFQFTLASLGLSLVASTALAAGVANGDFASGDLTGWNKAGNVAVDTSSQFGAPPAGFSAQAVLGTADASSFLFGGSAVAAATLEAFAGLGAGSLSALSATDGSGLGTDFTAAGGERLVFQWKFMSNELQGSPADDTAYVVLDNATFIKLTSVNSATLLGSSASPLFDETAYMTFTSAPLSAGVHSVSLGVFDSLDTLGASALAVTGVHLAPVPEPAPGLLLLAGLGALGLRRRRAA